MLNILIELIMPTFANTLSVFFDLCWNLWHQFGRSLQKKTICLVLSFSTFVCSGSTLNPSPYTSLQIPGLSLWVKKTGQEFLALEVCLVTQRTREEPCVAFNSLHCLPEDNLGRAQSLSVRGLWMEEWKVKYAFKCKTGVWPSIVATPLWECEICCWPRRQKAREVSFGLRRWTLVYSQVSPRSMCIKPNRC